MSFLTKREDGSPLSWLQPVKNFMPNGLHSILLAKGPTIVRLDMYRFETSYDPGSSQATPW